MAAALVASRSTPPAPGRLLAVVLVLAATLAAPATARAQDSEGPCTDASAERQYADAAAHDHGDIDQHAVSCRIEQRAFLPLLEELGARPDVVLGEMDVEADLAAVAVTYPEAGIVFFDVSDPAAPRFLSWYRSSACEGVVSDVNCGAFVDLSDDGRIAFLSLQSQTLVPGAPPPEDVQPVTLPGVEVVDVRDPRTPQAADHYLVPGGSGTHTARSHVIPEGPAGAGRAPGEYVFLVVNGYGLEIAEVVRTRDGPYLRYVNDIALEGTHDMFVHEDPLAGRTILYVAAEFADGFVAFDATNPEDPRRLGSWDLTPECAEDWYAHTIDVRIKDGRRYVTMPAETFDHGPQDDEERARGCGATSGNGDKPGPLWIVDATHFSSLAQEGDADETVKAKSQAALVATWTNAADRPGGHLFFTPHNQQVVGDRIYLSGYHSGVTVLDASAAFSGRRERPVELGFHVPHGTPVRPPLRAPLNPLEPFFSEALRGRPLIWDMVWYRGHILAADEVGGFYSLQYEGDEDRPAAPRLRLVLRYRGPRAGRCEVRAAVRGRHVRDVRRVRFRAGDERLGRDRRRPFRIRIRRGRLDRADRVLLARVTLRDGRRHAVRQSLRACARR